MDLKDIQKKMTDIFAADVDAYLRGETDKYHYKSLVHETYGNTDSNYDNRGRLLYGIRFGLREIPEPQREQMVRELFGQEIISREKVDFQGIGQDLELLSVLMEKYRKPEDEPLYDRAKNANFDCYCGYMKDGSYADSYPGSIDEYDLEDTIHLAGMLDMTDEARELVDIFKSQTEGDALIGKMSTFARYTKRDEDKELAVVLSYNRAFGGADSGISDIDKLIAAENMTDHLMEKGETDKAYELWLKHSDVLRCANGRTYFRIAFDLMKADSSRIRDIWKRCRKNIKQDMTNKRLYPVCYGVIKNCAELAGDKLSYALFEKMEQQNK